MENKLLTDIGSWKPREEDTASLLTSESEAADAVDSKR